MKSTLNILHQSDDGYAKVCGISIVSLLENNKHFSKINIYYLAYKVSTANLAKVKEIVSQYPNAMLHVIDAQKYHDQLVELKVTSWRGLYVTWLKLLALSELNLEGDRILYVNAHTVINGALDELNELDFKDAVMALSYDCILNDHKASIGLSATDGYYNCGVMLINHEKWMKENIDAEVRESLSKKSDYTIVDQDFCNVLFRGQIKTLSPSFNFSSAYYAYDMKQLLKVNNLKDNYFYSYDELMQHYYDPKITHSLFGLLGKPWEQESEHPQRFLWQKYLAMTPWTFEEMPVAKKTVSRSLYYLLPKGLFMRMYQFAVKGKYGVKKRSTFLVKLLNLLAPQKGT